MLTSVLINFSVKIHVACGDGGCCAAPGARRRGDELYAHGDELYAQTEELKSNPIVFISRTRRVWQIQKRSEETHRGENIWEPPRIHTGAIFYSEEELFSRADTNLDV